MRLPPSTPTRFSKATNDAVANDNYNFQDAVRTSGGTRMQRKGETTIDIIFVTPNKRRCWRPFARLPASSSITLRRTPISRSVSAIHSRSTCRFVRSVLNCRRKQQQITLFVPRSDKDFMEKFWFGFAADREAARLKLLVQQKGSSTVRTVTRARRDQREKRCCFCCFVQR